MKNTLITLAAILAAGLAQAQVYRCDINGKVTYSDSPCGAKPTVLPSERLMGNTVTTDRRREEQAEPASPPEPAGQQIRVQVAPAPGSCPGETDVKNIHTRLSARVVPPKNRAALYTELANAERCNRLGGRYQYDDWKRLEGVLRGDE